MDSPDIPTNPNVKKEICNQQIFYNYPKKQFLTLEEKFLILYRKNFLHLSEKKKQILQAKRISDNCRKNSFPNKEFLILA